MEEIILRNHIINILDITDKYRTILYNGEYIEDIIHFDDITWKYMSNIEYIILIPRYEGGKPTIKQTFEFVRKNIGKNIITLLMGEDFYYHFNNLAISYFDNMKPKKSKFDEKYGL